MSRMSWLVMMAILCIICIGTVSAEAQTTDSYSSGTSSTESSLSEAKAHADYMLDALRKEDWETLWRSIDDHGRSLIRHSGQSKDAWIDRRQAAEKRRPLIDFTIVDVSIVASHTLGSIDWNGSMTSPITYHNVVALTAEMTRLADGIGAAVPGGDPLPEGTPYTYTHVFHMINEDGEWRALYHPLFGFY